MRTFLLLSAVLCLFALPSLAAEEATVDVTPADSAALSAQAEVAPEAAEEGSATVETRFEARIGPFPVPSCAVINNSACSNPGSTTSCWDSSSGEVAPCHCQFGAPPRWVCLL